MIVNVKKKLEKIQYYFRPNLFDGGVELSGLLLPTVFAVVVEFLVVLVATAVGLELAADGWLLLLLLELFIDLVELPAVVLPALFKLLTLLVLLLLFDDLLVTELLLVFVFELEEEVIDDDDDDDAAGLLF